VEGNRDGHNSTTGCPRRVRVGVFRGRLNEVGDSGLDGVEGADCVDVDDGFEAVGGEPRERRNEVTRGAGSVRNGTL
jgi:hypothetical protein